MFFHKNFATQGLFPGLTTHRSVANLGHYEIEIIINPIEPTVTPGGGGGWLVPFPDREITIRITKNGEVWEETYKTSKYFADKVITVTAMFRTIRVLLSKIGVSARHFGTTVKEIFVRGKKL